MRGLAIGRRRDPADPPHAMKVVGHVHGEVVIDDVHRVARVDTTGGLGLNLTLGNYNTILKSHIILSIQSSFQDTEN